MKKLTTFYPKLKAGALLALSVLVFTTVNADIPEVSFIYTKEVCPGWPVLIKANRDKDFNIVENNQVVRLHEKEYTYLKLYQSTDSDPFINDKGQNIGYTPLNPNETHTRDDYYYTTMQDVPQMWFVAFSDKAKGWSDTCVNCSTPFKVTRKTSGCESTVKYDHSVICLGESKKVSIDRSLFKQNITDIQWERSKDKWVTWDTIHSQQNKADAIIIPDTIGLLHYRVRDRRHTQSSPIYTFDIAVQQCTPKRVDAIRGPEKVCFPNDGDGDPDLIFEGYTESYPGVLDSAMLSKAYYHWAIYPENEADNGYAAYAALQEWPPANLYQWGPAEFISVNEKGEPDPSTHYKWVKIVLRDNFPNEKLAGTFASKKFRVRCHLFYDGAPVTGRHFDRVIDFYRKPKVAINVDPICPFTDNKFVINAEPKAPYDGYYQYIYNKNWHTEHHAGDPDNVGHVVYGDKCNADALLAVEVKVNGLDGCVGTDGGFKFEVNSDNPGIECGKLYSDFENVFGELSVNKEDDAIVLAPDKQSVTFTLPLPKVTSTCDPDPEIHIKGSGTDIFGNEYTYGPVVGTVKNLENNTMQITVALNVTAGKPGVSASSSNGIKFDYWFTDACNRTSETCSQKVIVRDVDAPEIDCDAIFAGKHYSGIQLSLQKGCSAVPGYNSQLPLLEAPKDVHEANGLPVDVEYAGRLENPAVAPKETDENLERLFSKLNGLNDNYNPGVTYILWKFTDKAENASYCIQRISVINDRTPEVQCKDEDLGKMSVNENCTLSFNEIFDKIPTAQLPHAYDRCEDKDLNVENARLFFKEPHTTEWTEISTKEISNLPLFQKGKTYEFQWRFYVYNPDNKPGYDTEAFFPCPFKIEVVDSVPPVVDCSVLKSVAVPFNNNSKYGANSEDPDVEIVFDYASAQLTNEKCYCSTDVDAEKYYEKGTGRYYGDYTIFTLKDFFSEYKIPEATDACSGRVSLLVKMTEPGKAEVEIGTDPAVVKDFLMKHHFVEGNTLISYEFADESGNTSTCSQTIVVYSGLHFECEQEITLKADENCVAVLGVTPGTVTTAEVSFVREFRKAEYFTEDGKNDKYPASLDVVTTENFKTYPLCSDSMVTDKANRKETVYPVSVTKFVNFEEVPDATGETLENTSSKTSTPLKVIGHMYCSKSLFDKLTPEQQEEYKKINPGTSCLFQLVRKKDASDADNGIVHPDAWQKISDIELQTKTFDVSDADFAKFLTFPKGKHKLVWVYDNGQGEQKECTQVITVVDDTPPTITCGKWATDEKVEADANCVFEDTYGELTIDKLKEEGEVKDNCTNADELEISYYYEYWKNTSGSNVTLPDSTSNVWKEGSVFKIGTSKITWTIKDEAGNPSTCVSKIIVEDITAPVVDCPNHKYPTIEKPARSDAGCRALATDVFDSNPPKAPEIANDKCSPVKDQDGNVMATIMGVFHSRTDGALDPFADFTVGTTTIKWVFTDAVGNSDYCEQDVIITDTSAPILDCENLKPLSYTLPMDVCAFPKADVNLTKPSAFDNCYTLTDDDFSNTADGLTEFPIGTTTVIWTVTDDKGNSTNKFLDINGEWKLCAQNITIIDTSVPKGDCPYIEPVSAKEGECSVAPGDLLDLDKLGLYDKCDDKVLSPIFYERSDGKTFDDPFPVGSDLIVKWYYQDASLNKKFCDQQVVIKDVTNPEITFCHDPNDTLQLAIVPGACSMSPYRVVDAVKAYKFLPSAEDLCDDKLDTVIYRYFLGKDKNNLVEPDFSQPGIKWDDASVKYQPGYYVIRFTFFDDFGNNAHCDINMFIRDLNPPLVNCADLVSNKTLYPESNQVCERVVTFADLEASTDVKATELCSEYAYTAKPSLNINGQRQDKEFTSQDKIAIMPGDTIVFDWVYTSIHGIETVCKQVVTAVDSFAPYFDCSTLKDTITAELETGNSIAYSELVTKYGYKVPEAVDNCSSSTTTVKREHEGVAEEPVADFQLGITDITFYFTDEANNVDSCHQVVNVVDMSLPTVNCPSLNDTLACLTDMPQAYANYEEFVAAGGSVVPADAVDVLSFSHKDDIVGDACYAVVTRNYTFTTIKNTKVKCKVSQQFVVKDSIAPVYTNLPANGLESVITCEGVGNIVLPAIGIEDCDPDAQLSIERQSNQGADPGLCDYYNYDIKYLYIASDRCSNIDTLIYTFHVVDTLAPHVDVPASWNDPLHPVYLKSCIFAVPDITDSISRDLISENCGGNDYITIRQEPAAGTIVSESVMMKLFITDVCGNDTVLSRLLLIQTREEISHIIAKDASVCADEKAIANPRSDNVLNSLSSSYIRESDGTIWVQEFDGEWVQSKANLLWDYYRGSLSPDNIVFSTNEFTYGKLFADAGLSNEAFAKYNLLLRRSQSDYYVFVAYDSISGCSDTASIYIDVMEKPRVALESGEWKLCEGDSLALNGDFGSQFPVCISDMGSPITDEGWNISIREAENGTKRYEASDVIGYDDGAEHVAEYYATNQCGTTTSLNSLAISCDGSLSTTEDSIKFVNGPENLELLKADKYITSDSVFINVLTHFDPAQVLITVNPSEKPRIWEGEYAELIATHPYSNAEVVKWMQVVGEYDGEQGAKFDRYGNVVSGGSGEHNDIELDSRSLDNANLHLYQNRFYILPSDTTLYYVLVGNGVCPTVSSNVANVDVVHDIPTAFTPYDKDGYNDDFMKGRHVKIFNRYGQLLFEGYNGWDGTYRGLMADPGVYFYELEMKSGRIYKGSIEVVKTK